MASIITELSQPYVVTVTSTSAALTSITHSMTSMNPVVLKRENGDRLLCAQAARHSLDFDVRYGAPTGCCTTDIFIEAVYRSRGDKKP